MTECLTSLVESFIGRASRLCYFFVSYFMLCTPGNLAQNHHFEGHRFLSHRENILRPNIPTYQRTGLFCLFLIPGRVILALLLVAKFAEFHLYFMSSLV